MSRWSVSCSRGNSSAIERWLRWTARNAASPIARRVWSPPSGGSTLITSAPMSASTWPQNGPAHHLRELDDADAGQRGHAVTVAMDLAEALRREVADVRDDADTRHLYAADAGLYAIEPQAVAFPRDADEVAAAMSVCSGRGVPVVARGGGTSLGGRAAGGRGLVLDLSRHMVALAIEDETATVQPGVVQDDLNRVAARYGL